MRSFLKCASAALVMLACADAPTDILGLQPYASLEAQRSVTLSGPTACVTGDTLTYTATATDIHGKIATPMFGWASSNVSVAPFASVAADHQTARVLCATAGTSVITANWSQKYSSSKMLTVSAGGPPPPPPPPPPPATDTTRPPDRQANLTLVFDPAATLAGSGVLGGTPTAISTPTYNAGPPKRYDLDGTDAISYGAGALNATFTSSTGFTIITVVQTGLHAATNDVVVKDTTGLSMMSFHRNIEGSFEMVVYDPSPAYEFVKSTVVADSMTTVIAAVYDLNKTSGTRGDIYIGGSNATATHLQSGTHTGVSALAAPLHLGSRNASYPPIPAIGATYVYNTALTSTEISNNTLWIAARKRWTMPVATTVDHVNVTPIAATANVGGTQQFAATAYNQFNTPVTGQTFAWASSATGVATVNSSTGLATAVANGTANINATTAGKTGTAAFTVVTPAACTVVTDYSTHPATALAKPGYLATNVTDPQFGSKIIRITGDPGTAVPTAGGTWPSIARHEYSKQPVWFADQQLMVLAHMFATTQYSLFLDGNTYAPLFTRGGPPNGGGDWRPHPTKPDTAIVIQQTGPLIFLWNVRTNGAVTKFAGSGYTNARFGENEGNASSDGRYVGVNATRSSDGRFVVFVVDIVNGTKSVDIDVLNQGFASKAALDWQTVSPSGTYVVMEGTINGVAQSDKIFNRATGALVQTWTDWGVGHEDLGFDAAGNEIAFGRPGTGTFANRFVARRLATGAITQLTATYGYFAYHASMRSINRPGWGEATIDPNLTVPFTGEVMWVKTDGSGSIQRLAHHRSTQTASAASATGVPSPDGKRVLFASDWGVANGPVSAYVVDPRNICSNY